MLKISDKYCKHTYALWNTMSLVYWPLKICQSVKIWIKSSIIEVSGECGVFSMQAKLYGILVFGIKIL